MTQSFAATWDRAETVVNVPAGTPFYFPLQNPVLPSYVPPIDFTTVTSVELDVTRTYDTSAATWTTSSFVSVTAAGLVAVYTTVGGETPVAGVYEIRSFVFVGAQKIAGPLFKLYVDQP